MRPSMKLFATVLLLVMCLMANEMVVEGRTCESQSHKFKGTLQIRGSKMTDFKFQIRGSETTMHITLVFLFEIGKIQQQPAVWLQEQQ
ncbi:hypothetical protein Ccrd_024189 [Cynara cardunculus var. scolymus]|uniref:Uncharacterized protein n=1 Tax=Cynara cardunculus var. scolymus TaxID=59895 RepID=A0A118JSA8_CYNCS|nr:hypothetical protein Ccrd_024189 [Cynara cardunculus var. scolymus]